MTQQNLGQSDGNIIESMDQAFDNHGFYGLEYVLDEWVTKGTPPNDTNRIDSFSFWDFRD
jgi:hypothetical protein